MEQTDFSKFDNSWYVPGGSAIKRVTWYFINLLFFKSRWFIPVAPKKWILKLYGAKIGMAFYIKPGVSIKYPWRFKCGDYVSIGEGVWIDNLANVMIGNNVCISQGSMLLCGNHNYKKSSFDLIIGDITIEDGAWVGAKTVVCPGVTMKCHSVLTVGSILSSDTDEYSIYRGNPAVKIKKRVISE